MKPVSQKAYKLFHDGTLAFARMEAAGMRMDTKKLDHAIDLVTRKVKHLEKKLLASKLWSKWQREFRTKSNLDALDQINHLLFTVLKYPVRYRTPSGKPAATEKALEHVKLKFVRRWKLRRKYQKLLSTYLKGFKREMVDEFVHPIPNLHTTRTDRSSVDRPSFQNIPVRNAKLARIIRECFIPRKGFRRGTFDFKSIEVNVGACYCKDPVLISYCKDLTKDMHRDMAMECYMLKRKQVTDMTRYSAKNKFVFPQFYGSYYIDCAPALWEAIDQLKLTTIDGESLKKHLRRKGIKELGACEEGRDPEPGTFEHHIKKVEQAFWNERFPVYTAWKKRWYEAYLREGGFTTLTGFRIDGIYRRNQVINYGIQGSAFHCLLWVLIQLDKWLRKNHMRSVIIGQIHDSMEVDIWPSELKAVVKKINRLVEVDLANHFPWIIVPMRIEAKVSDVDGNWYEQSKI